MGSSSRFSAPRDGTPSSMPKSHQHAVADAVASPAAVPALTAIDGDGRSASRVFGIPIELAQPAEMLRTITDWVGSGSPHRVMYVNAHVVNESRAMPELRRALESAELVYCDGYGVRLAARVLEVPVPHRMTGADWVWGLAALCEAAGSSLYLLGSDPPIAQQAAARLKRWYPDLNIAGSHHGYFDLDSPHSERVIEDINARDPDILIVGMGTPKQELWVQRNAHRLMPTCCGRWARCSTTSPAVCRAPRGGCPTTGWSGSSASPSSPIACGSATSSATPRSCRG